jgi:lipoprotein LprG
MLSVESLHFVVERDGALVTIDPAQLLAFKRAEGDFEQPERMRAVLRVITAFAPVEVGMVVLGDEQYATDPITGEWGQMPLEWGQVNLMVLFDPETGLQALLKDGILNLKSKGIETIEGQPHYRIVGSASGERMSAMTGGFIGDSDVELEVWIGTADYHVRRLRIVETETNPDDPTTWSLEFSNLGQPVEINAPPVSSSGRAPEHVNSGISWPVLAQWS